MRTSLRTKLRWPVLVVLAALLVSLPAGCGGSAPVTEKTTPTESDTSPATQPETSPQATEKTFTPAELEQYNGKGGQPAYVAVDGVVYDVTGSNQWSEGQHSPCNLGAMAGKDLSAVLNQAPARMRGYIESKPVVGKLVP